MTLRQSALMFGATTSLVVEANASQLQEPVTVDLVQWIAGMIAVLIALLVFAWLLRRLGHFTRVEAGRFRVLAALSLGSRERVVLVQAGGKQLVLGVAPGSVRTLCVLEGEDVIGFANSSNVQTSFSEQLAALFPRSKS